MLIFYWMREVKWLVRTTIHVWQRTLLLLGSEKLLHLSFRYHRLQEDLQARNILLAPYQSQIALISEQKFSLANLAEFYTFDLQ